MPYYHDVDETYDALAAALGERRIAYVHVMDQSGFEIGDTKVEDVSDRIDQLLRVFRDRLPATALILAGEMTHERADKMIRDNTIDLAAFGRPFISNPDLVARLRNNWPLASPDPSTFYGGGTEGFIIMRRTVLRNTQKPRILLSKACGRPLKQADHLARTARRP